MGKGYWNTHTIMVSLIEEAGETYRLINHLYKPKKKDNELAQKLSIIS